MQYSGAVGSTDPEIQLPATDPMTTGTVNTDTVAMMTTGTVNTVQITMDTRPRITDTVKTTMDIRPRITDTVTTTMDIRPRNTDTDIVQTTTLAASIQKHLLSLYF